MRMMIALRFLTWFMSRTRFVFLSLSFSFVALETIEKNKNVASSRFSLACKKNEHKLEVVLFWKEYVGRLDFSFELYPIFDSISSIRTVSDDGEGEDEGRVEGRVEGSAAGVLVVAVESLSAPDFGSIFDVVKKKKDVGQKI